MARWSCEYPFDSIGRPSAAHQVPLLVAPSAQAIASFQLELEAFVLHLQRVEAVANKTTVAEVRAYQDKVALMDQERVDTLESIELLKKELVYVQQDRKNKLEYDALASEIMKYGTRDELETQLTNLQTTLDSLSGESAKYSEIMAQSKSRFEGIADNLKKLRADVGFEVGERERREVEREGEGDVEEETRVGDEAVEAATAAAAAAAVATAPGAMDGEEREGEGEGQGKGNRSALNPSAAVFKPNESSRASTPGATASNRGSAGAKRRRTARRAGDEEEEEEGGAQKRPREEGEMSDADDEEEEGAA